ncbi:MAG: winged helix-turn-helix domain-containing protein [Deltaproteobacteria bacterium]|nr:winged helix-turn-helix domain-containing protein [Deltaproteobacteria bacterium]
MVKKKILVVDDEKDIVELISYNLEQEGFAVIKAYDGQMAWERVKTAKPDLVVLDLMIPGIHGLEVCKLIRRDAATETLPIIMLTAKSDQVDKILGLELGADDYVTKPFNVRELIARIRAVLRRYEGRQQIEISEIFAFQGLSVNFGSCTVAVDGEKVDLSSREFKLLKFFTEHPGRVYSRDQLLDYVWGDEAFVEPRTVDVHISRLRATIEQDKENPKYILTVRGIGYKFADLT